MRPKRVAARPDLSRALEGVGAAIASVLHVRIGKRPINKQEKQAKEEASTGTPASPTEPSSKSRRES